MKTKLAKMWTALAAYQPQANAAGHGKAWARMCSERTAAAAADAYAAAVYASDSDAYDAAAYASDAAASDADADAAGARVWAQRSIEYINKARGNT